MYLIGLYAVQTDDWGIINMPVYLIVEHIITNAPKFEEYRAKVGPMMVTSQRAEATKCRKAAMGNRSGSW